MEERALESFLSRGPRRLRPLCRRAAGVAALGYAGPWSSARAGWTRGGSSGPRRRSPPRARAETPLRARLLARLGLELYDAGQPERRLELTAQALDLARRVGEQFRGRWRARSSPATTRCGGPRRSASASTSPPSCAGWRRRSGRPGARARGRGMDGRRPARAGRRGGRRHPDRRRLQARRGAAPAAVPVVDVRLPLCPGRS